MAAFASSSLPLVSDIRNQEVPKLKSLITLPRLPNRSLSLPRRLTLRSLHQDGWKARARIRAATVSTATEQICSCPDDLVDSIISKVIDSDRGVLLSKEQHKEVEEMAQQLAKFCVHEPVKSPLIFGEWDVLYCSVPTSPGGGYRSTIGRLVFKTNEMVQVVEAPDTVSNKVSFSAFGFLDGEVSLKGKLKVLDDKWIQVIFAPPQLKVGALDVQYGGESEVKLEITYVDEKIRLGKGSRGSLFLFRRRVSP